MRNVVPGFPDVDLDVWWSTESEAVRVVCVGSVTDILAAGITTAEILAKRPPGPRQPRRDGDGDKVHVDFWNIVRAGVVVPRAKVSFCAKSLANAMKLPGVAVVWAREQQAAAESEAAERRASEQRDFMALVQQLQPDQQRELETYMRDLAGRGTTQLRPTLRLVVDNTR